MTAIKAVFLNSPKAQCSIHESGKMVFEAIRHSGRFAWDYVDLDPSLEALPGEYGFALFNYHPGTMPWMRLAQVKELKCLKGVIILETQPDSVFALCPRDVFDVHLAIDPTIVDVPGRIYGLPRPIGDIQPPLRLASVPDIPTIGTYGFGTPGKGFERVVDAVNREFDRAVIRVNIPCGHFADSSWVALQGMPYADYLVQLMRRVAKPGISIKATHHYFTQSELVEWCRENTINIFLYERQQPGLSATTDQAVASGAALLVGDNPTFRHLHGYVGAYPTVTIREAVCSGADAIARLQADWNGATFRGSLERGVLEAAREGGHDLQINVRIQLREDRQVPGIRHAVRKTSNELSRFGRRLGRLVKSAAARGVRESEKDPLIGPPECNRGIDILFVNHPEKKCGVHQYGRNVASQLRRIDGLRVHYREISSSAGLATAVSEVVPKAVIFNHYPATMPWLTPGVAAGIRLPKLGFLHEMTQQAVDGLSAELFDWHLISDPTIATPREDVFISPRLLPDYCNYTPLPVIPTFGSFGFGFHNKGFEEVVDRVQAEYDVAKIVLRMPFNDIVDRQGTHHARKTADRCRTRVRKPGISLTICHDFLTMPALLDFLAGNTANIFLYDESLHRGLSSVLEYAIAAKRPLVINNCGMFRHVRQSAPGITIHERSIRQIVSEGISPLVPLYNEWSSAMFRKRWSVFLHERVLAGETSQKGELSNLGQTAAV